jgi:hypothetical protein
MNPHQRRESGFLRLPTRLGHRNNPEGQVLQPPLEERIPEAIGATEAEIVAAEARLGAALPGEIKVLYRVTRAVGGLG